MDFVIYAFILVIQLLLWLLAMNYRMGWFALMSMFIGIFGFYQIEQDGSINLAYFLNSSNNIVSQTTGLQVCLFILAMFILIDARFVIKLRKAF